MKRKHSKVLIVEDDMIIATNIKKILTLEGYNVISMVQGGKKAIETAGNEKPDLVILDIMLNDSINGIQAGNIISKRFRIPIIYLSALTDDETFLDALDTSPKAFLSKPFQQDDLIEKVKEVIDN
jgi:DNA-binding response OmpR family regulator